MRKRTRLELAIDDWCRTTGKRRKDLAEMCGVSPQWLSDIASGRRTPRVFKIYETLLKEGIVSHTNFSAYVKGNSTDVKVKGVYHEPDTNPQV